MRLATFQDAQGVHLGAVRGDEIVALDGVAPDMLTLIDRGPDALAQAVAAPQQARAGSPSAASRCWRPSRARARTWSASA